LWHLTLPKVLVFRRLSADDNFSVSMAIMFSFRVDRDSERNPRSLLRGKRANQKIDSIPLGEDSLSAIALWLNHRSAFGSLL
jgi:hypothetical protein